MFELSGILHYDPVRLAMKKQDESRILVLDIQADDLLEYYQWHLKKKYGQWINLQPPMFGSHVTVVRPQEVPEESSLWGKYENQQVKVFYNAKSLERHWEFWSLTVYSQELVNIRKEMMLPTNFRLHMTIGRQYPWQPREKIPYVKHDTDYLDFEPVA